ncbi:type I-C CRISPR-associated protein Cas8c/Csd1 [Jiella sp. MQZ9-1]|uniref:Type I-C CRISPR-associated protein Cas8c/Csd1 n=1 Tax=Jiella flava TaxID=2816857 RepID=A0A939G2N1_9HYPH|nr:type I-C CRISPR-associated protein Cas8c/Csd1 [Jiella flava]MBO0664438.1 type I-C CRISPR-associated protein Cas8c/Csd1 [Jiella flava]MCD2473074.1 type I-C CRISPR-associated protein Cas8c/Csd1 [Jiella flava]
MTVLSKLVRAYERMPDAPKPGFAQQRVGVVIGLEPDGTVASVTPLKRRVGKKDVAPLMAVPAPVKRTVDVKPNTFWDKTAYVLGVTAGDGKRTAKEHAAFVAHHRDLIGETDDPGLVAFLRFLDRWSPDQFGTHFQEEMKDENVVFALEEERRRAVYLHDRPAALDLIGAGSGTSTEGALCLATGRYGPVARLHPAIKGVWGGQSSGGSIVSFNLDAFESYGHRQGENAPVSQAAAEAYVGALNRFLPRDSGHRIQIGDASVVFWAEAPSELPDRAEAEALTEAVFREMLDEQANEDTAEAKRVGEALDRIRKGLPILDNAPKVSADVKFYVLGLAPNAARISIRFWLDTTFGALAENYRRFMEDMAILPPDRQGNPALWQYLRETAVLGKTENVPPNLAGEWTRAILAGTAYPLTLLNTVLMRIRADGQINARRAAILKALVIRNFGIIKEAPVGLDPNNPRPGYLLGRLFAAYEQAQSAALGKNVNATIKDKYYGSASAQPRKVFAILEAGSANHLSKLGKIRPGQRVNLEKTIGEIMDQMKPGATPDDDPFPATLPAAEQALFGLGYYHQRNAFFVRKDASDPETADHD